MSRHELWGGIVERAPRFGISLFRGRSGAISTLQPGSARPSTSQPPPLLSPPPRTPQTPRLNPFPARLIRQTVAAVFLIALFGSAIYWMSHPSGYNSHYQQARQAFWRGDWNGVVAQGDQMVRLGPNDPDGYSFRAQAYWELEQWGLAAANYRKVIALTPTDNWGYPILWQNLAYTEDYYGDHRQAIRDFTQAITLSPTIPDRQGWTADIEDSAGDAHKGRLWAYYHNRQYALALQDCNTLIAVHPYPTNLAVRGKLHAKMGDYAKALRDFQAALEENPRLQMASDLLAQLLGQMQQFKAAALVVEAEAREYPSEGAVLGNIGWWQYRAGQLPQAIAADQKALAVNRHQPRVLYNLGLTHAALGDWHRAEPAFREALRISNNSQRHGAVVDVQSALLEHPHCLALRQALALLRSAKLSAE